MLVRCCREYTEGESIDQQGAAIRDAGKPALGLGERSGTRRRKAAGQCVMLHPNAEALQSGQQLTVVAIAARARGDVAGDRKYQLGNHQLLRSGRGAASVKGRRVAHKQRVLFTPEPIR